MRLATRRAPSRRRASQVQRARAAAASRAPTAASLALGATAASRRSRLVRMRPLARLGREMSLEQVPPPCPQTDARDMGPRGIFTTNVSDGLIAWVRLARTYSPLQSLQRLAQQRQNLRSADCPKPFCGAAHGIFVAAPRISSNKLRSTRSAAPRCPRGRLLAAHKVGQPLQKRW